MYVWVGIDVDGQYGGLKEKIMKIDREMAFENSCFTLLMHISLKISFKIDENDFDNVKNTVVEVFEKVKPFEIAVKGIENHGNICWIRMWENECLNVLSAEINGVLKERYNIPLHEYDLDFMFHTSLFLSDDCKKVGLAYEQVKNFALPNRLIAKKFVIGTSKNGQLGTYKVVLAVENN